MPSRIIRESCRTSKTLARLSAQAERLFWRLVTVADDHGRFEAEASIVRSLCFPLNDSLKSATVESWLQELADHADPCVTLYHAHGKRYGVFNTWARHQRIRAQISKYPPPPSGSACQPMAADDGERPPMPADGDQCPRKSRRESKEEIEEGNRGDDHLRERFNRFWQAYPKKVGKHAAWNLWQSLRPDKELTERMLRAIEQAARGLQWQEQGGRFIPHPRTWLGQGRWDDEPVEPFDQPAITHRGLQALHNVDALVQRHADTVASRVAVPRLTESA